MTGKETKLFELWQVCKSRNSPPFWPEAFSHELIHKSFSPLVNSENPYGHVREGRLYSCYVPEQAQEYGKFFEKVMLEARELNYSDLDWKDDAAVMLGAAIAAGFCKNCEVLDLSGNCIGDEGVQALFNAIMKGGLQGCKRLDISNNAFGKSSHAYITRAFKAAQTSKALPEMIEFRM